MNNLRTSLKNLSVIRTFSSLKITVGCLLMLFVLTFWGTVAQVNSGLYAAQERYFNSFFFLALGFIPLPGAQLVLWVLFTNLICATVVRFKFLLSRIGILVIHFGLLLYFLAAFMTLHCVVESNVTLAEGAATNVSTAYHQWELSVWTPSDGHQKNVSALTTDRFRPGQTWPLPSLGLNVAVNQYYPNSDAFTLTVEKPSGYINDSGIHTLGPKAADKEPAQNLPGGIFKISGANGPAVSVLLYGGETEPTRVTLGDKTYFLQLRRKHYPLPFLLTLKDFRKEVYPNTNVARSYQSLVEISSDKLSREVLISMNEPLRYKSFTLYQASFSIDEMGGEHSTLAVVANSGRILPYVASLLTFGGLALHFLLAALTKRKFQ